MEITALSIDGVGRFARARVLGFGPNVNVLAAGNEAGKSTIFRAVRAVLFKRHGASDREIQALESDGSKLPVTITLAFTHEGASYEIQKSFLRNTKSSLTKDGKELARDRTADEMLWDVLGISPGTGKSVDDAAFGMLWVGQRSSFEPLAPSGNAASMINALIEAEVGTLVGGERAREVLKLLDTQLGEQLTPGGKVLLAGPLGEATKLRNTLNEQLALLSDRLTTLEGQFLLLADLRSQRATASDPVLFATATEDLKVAQESLASGAAATKKLATIRQSHDHALALLGTAERNLRDHNSLADAIDAARNRETVLEGEIQDCETKLKVAQAEADATRQAIAEANRQLREIAVEFATLERLESRLKGNADGLVLAQRLEVLNGVKVRLENLHARLAPLKVSQADLTELDANERERSLLQARLEAAATHFQLQVRDATAAVMSLNGRPVTDSIEGSIIERLEIRFGTEGTLTLSPPENFGADEQVRQDELSAAFASKLSALGLKSLDEARGQLAQRVEIERQISGIDAELTALGQTRTDITAAVEAVRAQVAAAEMAATDAGEDDDGPLPSLDDIGARKAAARSGQSASELERQRLEGLLTAQTDAVQAVLTRRGPKKGELSVVQATLASNLAQLPDNARASARQMLAGALETAQAAQRATADALAAEQLSAPDQEELVRRQHRVDRLEQAQRNQHARLGELEKQISNLEGHIQAAGGDGIGDELSGLEELAGIAARDVARMEERVKVAQLLRSVVKETLDEGRERYHAPIHKHLQPYLHDLFPGATIELGEGFEVVGLNRAGPGSEALSRLSDGTQEQIAVLVRLAMGTLLAEKGQIVPIILDDSLVYSDDDRIQRMFDSLTRAGTRQQVIVLTCRTRAFATLGGSALSIV